MRTSCVLLAAALTAMPFAVDTAFAANRSKKVQLPPIETRPADSTWAVIVGSGVSVPFRGEANFDQAGSGARDGMLYPGDNGAVFLGALFTHAVLEKGMRNRQRTQIQDAANQVLEPYRELIESLDFVALMQRAIALSNAVPAGVQVSAAEDATSDWVVEINPSFLLSRDARALVLEAKVVVRPRAEGAQPGYEHALIIVSDGLDDPDPAPRWLENDGSLFRETAAQLLASSLDIAVSRAARGEVAQGSMQTIRFQQGVTERIERVQLVEEGCDRTLAKTLRGAWLSVPRQPAPQAGNQCAGSAAAVTAATDEAQAAQ